MTSTHISGPPAAELCRLLDAELSVHSRIGHVALLLASAAMTVVVASLWLTEPALLPRTRVAFAVMTLVGLSWMAFSGWVLSRRRPLLGHDSLVAGRLAVTCTSTFAGGALAVGYSSGEQAAYAAAAMGVVLIAAAVTLLLRARRNVARLTRRREALERELEPARSVNPSRRDG